VLRVKYTARSRNQEIHPIGGVGFLAEPLSITAKSKKVTLQYSVFFPKGFDLEKVKKREVFVIIVLYNAFCLRW
jgi:hypothetical protein